MAGRTSRTAALILACALALTACGRSDPPPVRTGAAGGPRFLVVAAESFWGSLAAALAGQRAEVQSVIADPATDPHSYEPSTADARLVAAANAVIVNGLGYDSWASRLLEASPSSRRVVLDVGAVLGLGAGQNPHRWYFPADVRRMIAAISGAYEHLDPADAAWFAARRQWLLRGPAARFQALLAELRTRFAGVPVGYSESIFEGLGRAAGLRLASPAGFARAVAEGTDVSAADKQSLDALLAGRRVAVWVFNSQNVTPDVQRVNALARRAGVPLVAITETPPRRGEDFFRWQSGELEALLAALASSPLSRR